MLSNRSDVEPSGLPICLFPPHTIWQTAAKHLPILFLPPDDKTLFPSLFLMCTTKPALHQQSWIFEWIIVTWVDLEIFGLITLSNGSTVWLCGCQYIYSICIRYGDMAANQLPIFFLPPDDIASRRVPQHRLSFLFNLTNIFDNPNLDATCIQDSVNSN